MLGTETSESILLNENWVANTSFLMCFIYLVWIVFTCDSCLLEGGLGHL